MATLADVIIRLKKEGDLNRNSGTHSLRSVKELMVALNESLTVSLTATVDLFSNQMMPLIAPLEQDNDDDTGPADTEKEEDRREQNGVWERLIDTLEGVGKGLESFSDSVMDMVGNVAKGASIAGLLTLFLSPETAIELLGGAMEVFNDAIDAITGIFEGDTEGLKEFITNNPFIAIGATLLLVIKSIGIVGSILSSVGGLMTSLAGIGPALVTMGATVSSVLSFLGAVVLPLVAIGVALYALYKGLQDAVDVFMETGSIMDALQALTATFFSTLIGIPLNFVKSAISTIAGLFGFDLVEKELDNMDFQEIIADSINNVLTSIRDAFNDMFDFIVDIPNKIVQIVKQGVAAILPGWAEEKLGISPESSKASSDSPSDKKFNVTTNSGEKMSVSEDELTELVSSGQVGLKEGERAMPGVGAKVKAAAEAAGAAEAPAEAADATGAAEETISVMTKKGFKDLTKEEIESGIKDKSIKRSLGTSALRELKMGEKAKILSKEGKKSGTFKNDVLVQPNEPNSEKPNKVDDLGMDPPLAFIVPDSNLSSNLSVDGNVNSSLTMAQAENNALTTSTSSAIQALSPVLAAVSSGGSGGGGKSTSNTAVSNTTNINSTNSPDNISREWSFRPA